MAEGIVRCDIVMALLPEAIFDDLDLLGRRGVRHVVIS